MLQTMFYLFADVLMFAVTIAFLAENYPKVIKSMQAEKVKRLRAQITKMLAEVPDATLRAKAAETFKTATSQQQLVIIKNRLVQILAAGRAQGEANV